MPGDSIFKKKERIRPPRVHISYEVDINGAKEMKELPFVVGVMADLSGHPKKARKKPKERDFEDVDRDNFDDVLKSMEPRLAMKVANKLADDGSELSVELNFNKMADFSPENIVKQVKPLNDLLEKRTLLQGLLSKVENNEPLDELLEAILTNDELRAKLKDALKIEGPGGGAQG